MSHRTPVGLPAAPKIVGECYRASEATAQWRRRTPGRDGRGMGAHGMDAAPLVTICIVTGRRIPLLDACLASLQAQVDPPPFELLVCSDGDARRRATPSRPRPRRARSAPSRARTRAGAQRPARRRAGRVAAVPRRRRDGAARSAGPARRARCESIPTSTCSAARTTPRGQHALPVRPGRGDGVDGRRRPGAAALWRAPGRTRRRAVLHPLQPRGPALRRCVPFDPDLVCAEENALLSEMSRRGIAMHYDPDLAVFHERRDTFSGFRPADVQVRTRSWAADGSDARHGVTGVPRPVRAPAYARLLPIARRAHPRGACAPRRWCRSRPTPQSSATGAVAIAATLRKPTTLPLAAALIDRAPRLLRRRAYCAASPNARRPRAEPVVSAWIDATDEAEPTRVLVEPA